MAWIYLIYNHKNDLAIATNQCNIQYFCILFDRTAFGIEDNLSNEDKLSKAIEVYELNVSSFCNKTWFRWIILLQCIRCKLQASSIGCTERHSKNISWACDCFAKHIYLLHVLHEKSLTSGMILQHQTQYVSIAKVGEHIPLAIVFGPSCMTMQTLSESSQNIASMWSYEHPCQTRTHVSKEYMTSLSSSSSK